VKQIRHCWLILMLCWPGPAAVQSFESVTRRHAQILQRLCGIEHHQLSQRDQSRSAEAPRNDLIASSL